MSNSTNIPLSELLKSRNAHESKDEPKKKSREDWRKAKELEEARKAGTAPAAVDEEGRDINPHIPQYISSAPWYFGTSGPTLKHQRPQEEKQKQYSRLDEWYKRGVDTTNVAKKFRTGSCQNCGAITHQKKDCMERPRKIGAKFTGVQFGADEAVQPDLSLDFDGKRDRWAGYDPSMHQSIVEEYQKVEDAKRKMRADRLENGEGEKEAEEADEDEDEDKYVDDFDMPGTKVDSKQRITVRNLRIREDTAKYLRNLDPDSAYYDPKTRSMRDNPNPKADASETDYAGENFVRYSGDTRKHAQAQVFAWEAYDKGVDVHVLAEPTKLEMLQKVYDTKKEEYKSNVQDNVLQKYGGEEHLQAPPKALLLAQTEDYVEYSRYGKVIKGEEKPIVRSRYEEDVYPGNHTSVFGSFWHAGQWGYKCCHSYIKSSYCVGESGKTSEAPASPAHIPSSPAQQQENQTTPPHSPLHRPADDDSSSDSVPETDLIDKELAAKIKKKLKQKRLKKKLKKELKKQKKAEKAMSKESYEEQLKKALEKEEKQKNVRIQDDRKRAYNSMFDVQAPTDAEMEAFQMKRGNFEDPMASFL